MKVVNLLGERYKEAPSSCHVNSHKFMIRGGYMKNVSSGIYTLLTPAKRMVRKIENIIHDEMEKIGGQEVLFPVVMPATLWKESGRYENIGSELARFVDRNGNEMVLGMTHEEAAVHLAKNIANSYTNYPFMIYQIQTKFRDEPRARAGLIRVREFTMKDAYSFHTSQEDMDAYYQKCFHAYENIYKRIGAQNVIAVKSDAGMMGGNVSHEFMLLSDIGEDSIAICTTCDYQSNIEVAENIVTPRPKETISPLTKINTPAITSIDDLCKLLDIKASAVCKAVLYRTESSEKDVVVFIRGDLEVNETKLRNYLQEDIHPLSATENDTITYGFVGPLENNGNLIHVFDTSLKDAYNLVCGANEMDYHYTGLHMERDVKISEFRDYAKISKQSICPKCGNHTITIRNGIEVGNIFQLGTKYTESMNMTYLDNNGQEQHPIMGCYGIGVGRILASVCEESCDAYGPIWPMAIAPWQVQICYLQNEDEQVRETADALYEELQKKHIEVLYDDRDIRAGAMFAEADLFGIPIRVVVSKKNYDNGVIEVSTRDKELKTTFEIKKAVEELIALIDALSNL